MGCTNSKDDIHRRGGGGGGIRPLPRCFSTPVDKEVERDNHLVSLKSSTYGNSHATMSEEEENDAEDFFPRKQEYPEGFYDRYRQNFDRSSHVAAKTWSEVNNLLSDYMPPCKPNPNVDHLQQTEKEEEEEEEEEEEPETINTWELMEGLEEEIDDLGLDEENDDSSGYARCRTSDNNNVERLQSNEILSVEGNARKPLWMHFADDASDTLFDPEIVSGFRDAFGKVASEPSPNEPESSVCQTPVSACSNRFRCSSFARPINKSPFTFSVPDDAKKPESEKHLGFDRLRAPPGGEYRVVLYFTSLRAIRKTYEDCCHVRLILQGFRIFVDERDVSLHAEYREELQRLLGNQRISVPMLFVRGECIGGADRVIQLHEEGELEKYLEGFPVQSCVRVCDGCGDLRFIPCLTCHGSCKYYTDEDELIKCPDCNENGLIRCPVCY